MLQNKPNKDNGLKTILDFLRTRIVYQRCTGIYRYSIINPCNNQGKITLNREIPMEFSRYMGVSLLRFSDE